jgi:hypothetical protein
MQEDLFQYIWKMKLFNTNNLISTDGEIITILQVGSQNHSSGPDFFNAKIKIGNTLWAGNVELHINSSDWNLHEHQHDVAYENIILHVVYNDDKPVVNSKGEPLKTLVLENHINNNVIQNYKNFKENNYIIPCQKSIKNVPNSFVQTYLEKLIVNRLEHKSQQIEKLLAENNQHWEQAFYVQLASNFGFKLNQTPFELIARNTSLNVLAKHKTNIHQLEALLFGQAGFLNDTFTEAYPLMLQNEYAFLKKKYHLNEIPNHVWKLSRLRPVNFPTVRIAQFAALINHSSHLFSKIIATENANELIQLFKVSASPYWDTHYNFQSKASHLKKNIGNAAIENIVINTIVPFIFVYGKQYANESKCELALSLLENIHPEKNSIVELWSSLGVYAKNALQTQALIELKNNHCNAKLCLQCAIGHFLIKNN